MEEKISRNNVEMMVISNDNPIVERVSTDDIKKIL